MANSNRFCSKVETGKVENAMATKVAPFCSHSYRNLASTIRVPWGGEGRNEELHQGEAYACIGLQVYRLSQLLF